MREHAGDAVQRYEEEAAQAIKASSGLGFQGYMCWVHAAVVRDAGHLGECRVLQCGVVWWMCSAVGQGMESWAMRGSVEWGGSAPAGCCTLGRQTRAAHASCACAPPSLSTDSCPCLQASKGAQFAKDQKLRRRESRPGSDVGQNLITCW